MESTEEKTTHGAETGEDRALPGLAISAAGYRLVPEQTILPAGAGTELAFAIVDRAGETVRDFELEHERYMHLIVVRRDFEAFQHLHPRQAGDGSWRAEVDLGKPGVYRAFADFAVDGKSLTLATDLFAGGSFEPRPLPEPSDHANAGDGYTVTLEPGEGGELSFTVAKDGRRLESVDPYLGADGHLVALREHDQAFLHTHPQGEPGGPGPISFMVEYPSAGRYRLFLQFKHGGEVRTAAFTQQTDGPVASHEDHGDGDGGH